jgi:hypothetical protein
MGQVLEGVTDGSPALVARSFPRTNGPDFRMLRFVDGQTVCASMADAGPRTVPSVLIGEGIP